MLLAAVWLLGSVGCKKDDTAAPVGTGSYKLDGTSVHCQASTAIGSFGSSSGQPQRFLQVILTTIPQPATGPEVLYLTFDKKDSQAGTSYTLNEIGLRNSTNPTGLALANDSTAIRATGSASVSGTFRAHLSDPSGGSAPVMHLVSDGVFTNALL